MKVKLEDISLHGEFDQQPQPPCIYAKAVQRRDGKWVYAVTCGKNLRTMDTEYGFKILEKREK